MLDIVTLHNEVLHGKSEEISTIDDSVVQLSEQMFSAMYASNGIGLAAVQVGILKRMFVCDVPGSKQIVMVNPHIVELSSSTSTYEEGCLSIPGIQADVTRPARVTVQYIDLKGKEQTLETGGLLSTCIQHEFDHLNGVLFIDRLDPEIKMAKIREYRKLTRSV
jgi:peptide deformylase